MAADYKGVVYGFSSAGALNGFIEDPSPFLGPLPELMPRKLGGLEMLQVGTHAWVSALSDLVKRHASPPVRVDVDCCFLKSTL